MGDSNNAEFPELVSVIITSYGDASPLPRAIESVLSQSYTHLEILVVDDNGKSTLKQKETESVTAPYLSDERLSYIPHDVNMNGAAARNTGILHSNGTYVTFLDNDDLMMPSRVENAVNALRSSGADACFADVLIVRDGQAIKVFETNLTGLCWKEPLCHDGCMGTGSNLFLTRRGLRQTGFFDVSFERNQDVEYMIRYLSRFAAVSTGKLELIKGESGTNNAPSFAKMKRTKNHLESVFETAIAQLDDSDLVDYKVGREQSLLYAAKTSRDKVGVRTSLENLKQLNVPIGLFRTTECFARVYCPTLFEATKKAVRYRQHRETMKKLDNEVIAMLPEKRRSKSEINSK